MNTLLLFNANYLIFFEIAAAIVYFYMQSRDRQRSMAIVSVLFLPTAYIVAKITSLLYFNPRPFVTDAITPLFTHAADNGFPSDHALLGCAIAAILFLYNKKIGMVAFVIAGIIGVSRVYAGVHHWIDIFGSAGIVIITMAAVKTYVVPRAEKVIDGFLQRA